jgi:hypothetical protein
MTARQPGGHPQSRGLPGEAAALALAAAGELLIVTGRDEERRRAGHLVFVLSMPGWLRFPAWLHGTAPQAFRLLAGRGS